MLHIADPEVSRRIERVGLAEKSRIQGQRRLVAVPAAELSKSRLSAVSGSTPYWVVSNDSAGYVHPDLKNRRRCYVAHAQFVRYPIFIEIVGGDCVSLAVLLTDAEPLDRLHTVMMVEGVDSENAHRVDNAFLMKRLDDEVSI